MSLFLGAWEDEADICRDMEISPGTLAEYEVLIAGYWSGSWEGSVWMLLRKDGQLYEVHAGHCSCNGLEGQFGPSATTVEYLKSPHFNISYKVDNKRDEEAVRKYIEAL